MIVILCLIILSLVSFISLLTIKILQQKKLILSYDNCLKKQGNMQKLMFLANLAKTCGHEMKIEYLTMHDFYYVLFYMNGKHEYEPYCRQITDDESLEATIKELEWLIK